MAENLGMDIHVTVKGAKQVAVDLDAVTKAAEKLEAATDKATKSVDGSSNAWQRQSEAFIKSQRAQEAEAEAKKKAAEETDKVREATAKLLASIFPLEAKLQKLDKAETDLAKSFRSGALDADTYADALKELNNQRDIEIERAEAVTGANKGLVDSLGDVATAIGSVIAAGKLMSTVMDTAMAAGRYDQLGVIMETVGRNAGYTTGELQKVEKQLQATGISMSQSRDVINNLISSNIDLAKATDLARLAQDAATIGNVSSSDALERLVSGISTAQTQVLRGIGLNVNFEQSYQELAKTLGVTTAELSENDKMQARVNAVMSQAPSIAGAYAASMETANKQIGSMSRHVDDLKIKIGQGFQPVLKTGVGLLNEILGAANENSKLLTVALGGVATAVGVLTAGVLGLRTALIGVNTILTVIQKNPVILGISLITAALAMGAIAFADFGSGADLAEKEIEKLDGAVKSAAFSLTELNQQRELELKTNFAEVEKEVSAAENQMMLFQAQAETARKNLEQFPNSKMADEWRQDLDGATIKAGDLANQVITLRSVMEALSGTMAAIRAESAMMAAEAATQAQADKFITTMTERLEKLKASKSAVAEAELAFSKLTDGTEDQKKAMIAAAKSVDDYVAEQKKLAEALKSGGKAADQEKNAIKALVDRLLPAKKAMADLATNSARLAVAQKSGLITSEQYAKAMGELSKEFENTLKAQNPQIVATEALVKSTEFAVNSLAARINSTHMTEQAVIRLARAEVQARIATLEAIKAAEASSGASQVRVKSIELEIAALRELHALQGQQIGLLDQQDAINEYKKFSDEAQKENDQIRQSLTDALMRAFESGQSFADAFKSVVMNMFKTLILRPIIEPVMSGVTGALFGGGKESGGIGGILSGVNSVRTLGSALSGGLVSGLSSGIASIGAKFGSSALTSFATGMKGANLAAGLAGPTTAGAGGAMGAGAAFATAAPYLAAAAAAYTLISSLTNKGETRYGGGFHYDPTLDATRFGAGPSGGFGGNETLGAVNTLLKGQFDTLNSVLQGVGATNVEIASILGSFESSEKGRGGTSSGGQLIIDGQAFYFGSISETGDLVKGQGFGGTSGTSEEMFGNLTKEIYFSTLEAYQLLGDKLPSVINGMLADVDVRSLSADQAQQAVNQISEIVSAVNNAIAALDELPLKNLQNLTFDLTASLMQAAGGFEQFSAGVSSFYAGFYTEQEQFETALKSLKKSVGDLGFELPATRDGFRDLVESLDATDDATHDAIAGLLGLSGAADQVYKELERQTDEVTALAKKQADDVINEFNRQQDVFDSIGRSIDSLLASISGAFANLKERITLDLMGDDQERYDYYKSRYDALSMELSATTDATRMAEILREMNSAATSAYGLLKEDQKLEMGPEILESINANERIARESAERMRKQQEDDQRRLMDELLNEISNVMNATGDKLDSAAGNILSASENMARASVGSRTRRTEATI